MAASGQKCPRNWALQAGFFDAWGSFASAVAAITIQKTIRFTCLFSMECDSVAIDSDGKRD